MINISFTKRFFAIIDCASSVMKQTFIAATHVEAIFFLLFLMLQFDWEWQWIGIISKQKIMEYSQCCNVRVLSMLLVCIEVFVKSTNHIECFR